MLSIWNEFYIVALSFKHFFKLTNNHIPFSFFPFFCSTGDWVFSENFFNVDYLSSLLLYGIEHDRQRWALMLFLINFLLSQKLKLEIGFKFKITCSDIIINYHLSQKLILIGQCGFNHLTIILKFSTLHCGGILSRYFKWSHCCWHIYSSSGWCFNFGF